MKKYSWKQYSQSITVTGESPSSISLFELINLKQQCAVHSLDRATGLDSYRSYRRGKNRCKFCGTKIKEPMNA